MQTLTRLRAYERESMKNISLGSHNLTKLNRISSSICVKDFSWIMTYGSGRTLHIAGELAFLDFRKITPDFKHHQNKLVQLYLPYLYPQQLRLGSSICNPRGSSICNPRNFQVHWQDICVTNRFKLKRTLIFKLGTTDMIEQSKTHPFKLSYGVKTFLSRIMEKGK